MQRLGSSSGQSENVVYENGIQAPQQILRCRLSFIFVFRLHEGQGNQNLCHNYSDLSGTD